MCTRRAGVGSAEARRAGANGARIDGSEVYFSLAQPDSHAWLRETTEVRIGGPEQKLGSSPKQGVRRLGDAAVEN